MVFVRNLEDTRQHWQLAIDNNMRLQRELESAMKSMADLESKLNNARKLLELESKARREAENDRDQLEKKLYLVKDLLNSDHNIKDETRTKLDFLNQLNKKRRSAARLTAVEEQLGPDINTTGSILSDLSLTRSENDFLDRKSFDRRQWRKSKSIIGEGTPQKRKSSTQKIVHMTGNEKIVAHTKVTVPQDDGPIIAQSHIEAIPQNDDVYKTPAKKTPPKRKMQDASAPPLQETFQTFSTRNRPHEFETKAFFVSQLCNHCSKNIRFGQMGLRCRNCNVQCHSDPCGKLLDIICAPQSAQKSSHLYGPLTDYVTPWKPMIPALLIHCVNEIEKRGLQEQGLYRVSGSDREVKGLKEKFLKSKTVPSLKDIDVHVLCGCVKDFLRSLQDRLIPDSHWADFSNAVQQTQPDEIQKSLKKCIFKLNEANRDTLAFMMIHLQRIASCPDVKMPLDNLSKVFAPTLVGSSLAHQDQSRIYMEALLQVTILKHLLDIPLEFWVQFTNPGHSSDTPSTPASSETERYMSMAQGK